MAEWSYPHLTEAGSKMLAKRIEEYWRKQNRTVYCHVVRAVEMKAGPIFGVRSNLGMYLPPACKRAEGL